MRKPTLTRLAPMLLAALALPGCATAQTVGRVVTAVQQPADAFFNTLADEKAYYGLLRFEQSANQIASAAVDMGFITPGSPVAVQIADLLQQLTAVVEAARQAKALNDAPGVMAKIAEGKALYQQIMALLGR